jgi:hypothetical protein
MSWFTIKDTRGRESRTLFFVGVSWLVITARFVLSFLGGVVEEFAALSQVSILDYAKGVTVIMAIWLGREWLDKTTDDGVD